VFRWIGVKPTFKGDLLEMLGLPWGSISGSDMYSMYGLFAVMRFGADGRDIKTDGAASMFEFVEPR